MESIGASSKAAECFERNGPGERQLRIRSSKTESPRPSHALWDPLVHTWDLAEAVGQPTVVDTRLCELGLVAAREHDAKFGLRRPGVAEAPIGTTSVNPLERLLGFAGRSLDWRHEQDID